MRRGTKLATAVAAVLGSAVLAAPPALAAPANDDFVDREVLSGALPIVESGSNVGATREDGEPFVGFGAGHTIWYEWEATETSFVTVGTCGTSFNTEVSVFTGTAVNALTKVADSTNGGPGCPSGVLGARQATFKAVDGTKYEIVIDGDGFYLELPKPVAEGPVQLQVEATPPPPNDDFADAAVFSGRVEEEPGEPPFYFASTTGYNWGADKQAGEPEHGGDPGGASVWYSWTAPATGSIRLGAMGNWFEPLVTIYSGSALGGLVPLASAEPFKGMEGVPVTAGTTYRIAVDGKRDPGSEEADTAFFWMVLSMQLPPALPPPPAVVPDTTPPETTLLRISHLKKRSRDPATKSFAFRSSEAPEAFRCKIDGGPFAPCRAPKTYRNLKRGRHRFEVAAVDAAGNADPTPAVARFRVPKPKPIKMLLPKPSPIRPPRR